MNAPAAHGVIRPEIQALRAIAYLSTPAHAWELPAAFITIMAGTAFVDAMWRFSRSAPEISLRGIITRSLDRLSENGIAVAVAVAVALVIITIAGLVGVWRSMARMALADQMGAQTVKEAVKP